MVKTLTSFNKIDISQTHSLVSYTMDSQHFQLLNYTLMSHPDFTTKVEKIGNVPNKITDIQCKATLFSNNQDILNSFDPQFDLLFIGLFVYTIEKVLSL